MKYGKVSVNFHQTFKAEGQYILRLLEFANSLGTFSVKQISNQTGIPNGVSSGKVEPHIFYASFMGLISFQKKDGFFTINRTPLGNVIFENDPGIQEKLSLLICHGMICRELQGAPMFSATFKEVLPKYHGKIKKEVLAHELSGILDSEITKKTLTPMFSTYDDLFSPLKLLSIDENNFMIRSLPFENDFIFAYAFLLFVFWEEAFSGQDEISSIDFEKLSFGKTFGWTSIQEYEALEKLSDKGLIRLNRQLMPYTITKTETIETLERKLFSELC